MTGCWKGEKMISLDFLENVDVFKTLDDNQLKAIQECGDVVDFNRDDRIFLQGDDAAYVWIVLEGDVELKAESADKTVLPGSAVSFMSIAHMFGWTCFVPPYKYRLSGYCASRWCKMIKFKREDLIALFEKDEIIGFQVMNYLIEAVGKQFEQYQDEIARKRGIEMMSQW
jgi:CRP-like cAMP-binding protein